MSVIQITLNEPARKQAVQSLLRRGLIGQAAALQFEGPEFANAGYTSGTHFFRVKELDSDVEYWYPHGDIARIKITN